MFCVTTRHARWCVSAVILFLMPWAAAAQQAAVRPAPLASHFTTLPNGLGVVILEDHSTPVVAVQVWYHVGAKDERPDRRGLARLFEVLLTLGSKNVKPGQHAEWLGQAGGQTGAYTTEDATVFWNTVPPSSLPLTLWLEADRMASPRFDRTAFERVRASAQAERKARVKEAYARLAEHTFGYAFLTHPYQQPPDGPLDDLDTATIDDVRDFFRTYYVPNNAVLVVAGDVDREATLALVASTLGRVPRRGRPVPRVTVVEPPALAPRSHTVYEDWPLPAVVVAHHVPADGHQDVAALKVASKILADGEGARLFRSLVLGSGMVLSVRVGGGFVEHPGLFMVSAIVQPGFSPEQVESGVWAELDGLRTKPVSGAELERARRQVARDFTIGRTAVAQKAQALGRATLLFGGPERADDEYDRLMAVTVEDIQRVAATYFAPSSRLALRVLPNGPAGGAR